jgi:hypothetical protein
MQGQSLITEMGVQMQAKALVKALVLAKQEEQEEALEALEEAREALKALEEVEKALEAAQETVEAAQETLKEAREPGGLKVAMEGLLEGELALEVALVLEVVAQAQARRVESQAGWEEVQAGWEEAEAREARVVQAQAKVKLVAEVQAARPMMPEPTANTFTYREVLADSDLKEFIYSIEPDLRYSLARHLCHHSQEYWWIQILAPITRLPTELLQQIFLIIIDEASGPPLVLMLICKYWYTIVTGIWASLELGITTPKDAVTNKLERNQWLLDILVDTESDRGHFIPSGGTYEAIFAVIEAAS